MRGTWNYSMFAFLTERPSTWHNEYKSELDNCKGNGAPRLLAIP